MFEYPQHKIWMRNKENILQYTCSYLEASPKFKINLFQQLATTQKIYHSGRSALIRAISNDIFRHTINYICSTEENVRNMKYV